MDGELSSLGDGKTLRFADGDLAITSGVRVRHERIEMERARPWVSEGGGNWTTDVGLKAGMRAGLRAVFGDGGAGWRELG